MKKGRSNYSIKMNCDSATVNNLMQSYIQGNEFKLIEKKGEQYFRAGNSMSYYKGLKYNFDGQNLNLEVWLDGALGNFPLEQNLNAFAMDYRNSLNTLFQEIEKINGGVNMNNNINNENNLNTGIQPNQTQSVQQPMYNQQPVQQATNSNQFTQAFQDENIKKKEKLCEIGFWISILGLVSSFAGVVMGVIVYALDFYFASQGLKTRKKGKAIATIVLSIISILVVILQLIGD